jgi:hypothetical protein
MCVYSMIVDYERKWVPEHYPWYEPHTLPWNPLPFIPNDKNGIELPGTPPPGPTPEEFDALKDEVKELRKLLQAAKEFDEATGQHDCEAEEKVRFIKDLAKFVGVDLSDVLP